MVMAWQSQIDHHSSQSLSSFLPPSHRRVRLGALRLGFWLETRTPWKGLTTVYSNVDLWHLKSRRWQVWSTAQQRIWTIWSAASRFSHLHFVKLPFFFSSCILFILSTFQGEKTHQEIVLGHSQFVVSAVVLGHRMARTILKSNVLNHFRRM